ncbi:MAG: arsenic resistance N-acetyltransferase ArsN2 [Candidatus Hermodarchaeota archaeon]
MLIDSVLVSQASKEFIEDAKIVLNSLQLPLDGVKDQFENFLLLLLNQELIGLIGLEIHGSIGLLRSLAVKTEYQGNKLGSLLTDRIIEKCKKLGIQSIYLLTETAKEFFLKKGFTVLKRDEAPLILHQAKEFAYACPESATLMKKTLK